MSSDLITVNVQTTWMEPIDHPWLAGVEYKPGWTFAYHAPHAFVTWSATDSKQAVWSPPWTRLTITVECVDSTSQCPGPFRLSHEFFAERPFPDRPSFLAWLAECVLAVERHESREFFKVDGERWLDPHRDGNTHLYD